MWITLVISFLFRTNPIDLKESVLQCNAQEFHCSLESNKLTERTVHSSDIVKRFFCAGERNLEGLVQFISCINELIR